MDDNIRDQRYYGASNMHREWNDLQALFAKNKQHDQLRDIEASHNAKLINSGELETGKGKNQVASLDSLMKMFNSVCVVLQYIIKSGNLTQMSKADGIYDLMTSIEFVFILHFMIEMLGITNDLCQIL
uniref:DUF4371 domain-containing protein n=1 Tax=Gossypium raimondii TaxID=29730 RepID=A0A0D2RAY5_GOSRA|nr:hypothetical protein B456_005G077000 [Gossypium raimondii]